MPSDAPDRLISASEVERWCYCPLSWKLERMGAKEDTEVLDRGSAKHEQIGMKVGSVKIAQNKAREDTIITWTFLIFSVVLLLMGISLVVVTWVGSLYIDIWRIGVIFFSILLIGVSVVYYFSRRQEDGKGPFDSLKGVFGSMGSNRLKRSNTPLLFYLYGILLMVNGVILLRPFGMEHHIISAVLAGSLLLLYLILLISFTNYFMSRRSDPDRSGSKIGGPMVLMLLISLSVLFIFISDEIDSRGDLGWAFLFISLLWFIGAIGYDLVNQFRRGFRKKRSTSKEELTITVLALLASVFTASTFLAKGDNLQEYYLASVVMAAAWLIGAVFFFWRGIYQRRTAENGLEELSLPTEARIVSYDDPKLRKENRPLTSIRHFLVGTPDLLLDEEGYKIPVEVKTGRIPPRSHFSHVMQLSAYMILTDVNFDQTTPYGYIDYSPGDSEGKRFKVEWDLMTKALVLSKVSEIREAERTEEVHRNHERAGKCRNCSRSQGCPEKLV
ncbi:MAG: Dna2/Cas4 domain-containing protein [Candidatus Thermoplasmatota archaeon]|nr:Dna2/Cas4 domain-containing protein [Candidatus Thermoplasmatota archaeon]